MNKTKNLGIIFVPKTISKESIVMKYKSNKFKDILEHAKKHNKDDENK
jgi:hypothetical protein